MRAAHGSRSTVVGTTARSMLSLYATAAVAPVVREIGVFNTTTTATAVAVARMTNATNVGTGLTETAEDDTTKTIVATIFAGHTGDGGVGGVVRQAPLGGAIGSGVVFTFGDQGLVIPAGTANGIGLVGVSGVTGQICDCYFVWDE